MQHVVSQLITKKEELLGELKFHKSKVQQLEEFVKSIDVSISVLDPEFDLKTIIR
jgi:predicted nuclease with TOPRIM domain